jgi:hypothetical protein
MILVILIQKKNLSIMFCASIKRKLDKENDGSEPNKEKKAHRILKDNPKYIIVLTL